MKAPNSTKNFNPLDFTVANILERYYTATKEELIEGLDWYSASTRQIKQELYSVSLTKAACIVAALSPRMPWERNIEAAKTVLSAYHNGLTPGDISITTFDKNKAKAFELCALPDTDNLNDFFTVLKGNKTQAFAANLSGHDDAVTIDGHAYSIAKAERVPLANVPSMTDRQYHYIADLYREAADTVGITPYQVQAITWLTYRRINGIA